MCLDAWPLNESEAEVDLVLLDAAIMLISRNLKKKRSEVSIKRRSTPSAFPFKGQATKDKNAKWCIEHAFNYVYFRWRVI